jgi:hypothetical protein
MKLNTAAEMPSRLISTLMALDEIPRFQALLRERPQVDLVMGARVQMLGRTVRRSPLRHYLGRVFATAVSQVLRLAVYDTQCGAKLLRNRAELALVFDEPFCVNWTFDVALIARLLRGSPVRAAADAGRTSRARRSGRVTSRSASSS